MTVITLPHDFMPLPYQARYMDYFDRGGKRAMWIVHRRGGKDLTALHQLCKMAMQRRGLAVDIRCLTAATRTEARAAQSSLKSPIEN